MSSEKKSKVERPLTELLKISEKGCFEMSKFVQDVYKRLNEDRKLMKEKADNSFFTIADALVQVMVRTMFPSDKFREFCGEESPSNINIEKAPYSVDGMELPPDLSESFKKSFAEIKKLAKSVDGEAYKELGVFVDPIDGTREFCTGLGSQCSICIGFTRDKLPVAGIVFRPIPLEEGSKLTYMAGCKQEGYTNGVLDYSDGKAQESLLTSNGSISKFTDALIKELDFVRYKAGVGRLSSDPLTLLITKLILFGCEDSEFGYALVYVRMCVSVCVCVRACACVCVHVIPSGVWQQNAALTGGKRHRIYSRQRSF